jgi:hypothetical protein
MITEHADLKALIVKDIHTASDRTRKVVPVLLLYYEVIYWI